MRIAVLGPLQVAANDSAPVEVPGARERLLLGVLAAAAPGAVAEDRLIACLRSDGLRSADVEALRGSVRRLRSALEPGLPERSSGQYVLRRGPGYARAVARGDVDALRFTDLAARGRARLAAGDPADAARQLGTALALWRGEPFGDWPDAAFAEAERRRLTAIRAGAESDLPRARELLARRPEPPEPVLERAWLTEKPAVVVPVEHRTEAAAPPADPPREDAGVAGRSAARRTHRTALMIGALVVAVTATLVAARLSARSEQADAQAATVSDADRMAALSVTTHPLDVSLLLAVQAFRLADTQETRRWLTAVVVGHSRVERTVSFMGSPHETILTGGGTVTFGIGLSVVGWSIGPTTLPSVLMDIPREWGSWIVAAPSPVKGVLMAAGMGTTGPWLRMVSTLQGTSRLLLEGDRVGGRPVDGTVSADGRRLLLVVAGPDAAAPDDAARWHLVEVDATDGSRRDTGITGTLPVSAEGVRADFADDAESVVVWADTPTPSATLVQLADGSQTPITTHPWPAGVVTFRATPTGAAMLWDDGLIVLLDRAGATVEELYAHQGPVRDLAVSPDGRWAVSAGDDGEVFRWDVDPSTGRWAGAEPLAGHGGDVVGVEVDASGRRLASVSADHSMISWDMSPGRGRVTASPVEQLHAACAMVARDFTPAEWRRYLPDRPWQPTCSDLE